MKSIELQFKCIESNHVVFMIHNELSTMYLALFVDDMIIFENDKILIREIKIKLFSHFKMKDLRIMKYFLELKIEYNLYKDIIIFQRYYIEYILE